jgi:hypothetical protein
MFYFAEVRNIEDDETKSGRVKIRLYPHGGGMDQSDTQNIKDEQLPWAMPMMSATSPSTNKTGTIPTGLQVGSRVLVCYAATDVEKRYPIVVGSFHRAFPPVTNENESDSNKDGFNSVDKAQKGVDLPSMAMASDDNKGKNPINPRITPNNVETEVV